METWPALEYTGGNHYKDTNAERDAESVDHHAKLGWRVTKGHCPRLLFVRVGRIQDLLWIMYGADKGRAKTFPMKHPFQFFPN